MITVRLNLGTRSYDIIVGAKSLSLAGESIKKLDVGNFAYVVTHKSIRNLYGKPLENSFKKAGISVIKFKILPETEKSKSLPVAISIIEELVKISRQKRVFLVSLGGGVVGDVAGFAAAIYKRGIPYIQIPTTLLAQVDAAIGGKTAVDLKQAKNLIGTFYQPKLVLVDPSLLKSLDQRQMRSGIAEIIKYGIIQDRHLFNYLERKVNKVMAKQMPALEFIISRCIKIKADIVQKDEREEKSLRTILNFGHTIGHALEAASGFKGYSHGEAVAIGMLCAADISLKLNLIKQSEYLRIEKIITSYGLTHKIKKVALKKIIRSLFYDKKFHGGALRFVLIRGIGDTLIKENLRLSLIEEVLRKRSLMS